MVSLEYDQFDAGQWEDMAFKTLTTILEHLALQRHPLAARPRSIEEAVGMSNEYMLVYTRPPILRPAVAMCDDEESEEE